MAYRNLLYFILVPIILGIILANLTWFWVSGGLPVFSRGMPFPFFDDVVECVLPPGATECPGDSFYWDAYILDLFFWAIIILTIAQSIKFFTKLRWK